MPEYSDPIHFPFQVRDDRDYSGTEISKASVRRIDLSRSFFNGAVLQDCEFHETALNNSEFSEAWLNDLVFKSCNLSATDFVNSHVDGAQFDACELSRGEWRNAKFTRCRFVSCNFDHTTITLCTFVDCVFDEASVITMEHRAIYHNVFSSCQFERAFTHPTIISKNFGLLAAGKHRELIRSDAPETIEQLCYLSNFGAFRPVMLTAFVEQFCSEERASYRIAGSTFSFITIILAVLSAEGRISAPALIYIEDVIGRYASSLGDQHLFMTIMGCILQIRNSLYELSEAEFTGQDSARTALVERVRIHYAASYTRDNALALCEALAEAAGSSGDGMKLEHFSIGSTLIELGVTAAITTASLLSAVNLILRQATTTVKQAAELKRAMKDFVDDKPQKKQMLSAPRKLASKVPAILNRSNVSPKLTPIRNAVQKNGRRLIEVDDKASVTIFEASCR